ncbi:MAG TPA: hypothetical protein VFM18_24620 [Methanosarcina sp.]|nr:hypothetical protein [Methanosarcina sp.]
MKFKLKHIFFSIAAFFTGLALIAAIFMPNSYKVNEYEGTLIGKTIQNTKFEQKYLLAIEGKETYEIYTDFKYYCKVQVGQHVHFVQKQQEGNTVALMLGMIGGIMFILFMAYRKDEEIYEFTHERKEK